MKFERLFEPGSIGKLRLKNRIIMLPMGTGLTGVLGEVTDELIAHYVRRAKGGAALVSVQHCCCATSIDPLRGGSLLSLRADDDVFIPDLARLAEAVHEAGAKISIQLSAGLGSAASTCPWTIGLQGLEDIQSVSSSPTADLTGRVPRELNIAEIEKIVQLMGEAAARVKIAGFDAVEVNAHGGYLIAQFMSSYFNKRTDKYGGDLEGRLRFLLELLESTKKNVGDDFPLIVRYAIDECVDGGRGVRESQVIARRLQEAGVHAISADAGLVTESGEYFIPPVYMPRGLGVQYAQAVKEVVDIPVIVAYRLGDPELAESVLEEGKADFIGLGRPLLADPDLPNKVQQGQLEDIRSCIACNECFHLGKRPIRCALNAAVGRETKYGTLKPAAKVKKVIVIGGGPGGMEAARVLALRGHKVTLYEKANDLGGQLKWATVPPHKEEYKRITDYYAVQLRKLPNLKLRLKTEATAEVIKGQNPDALIIATGGRAAIPEIPGIHGENVVTALDMLGGAAATGETVVVAGGGSIGCETANFLAGRGKKVTLIEMLDKVACDLDVLTAKCLIRELHDKKVTILTQTKLEEITSEGVIVLSKDLNKELIEADSVVLAFGMEPVNTLEKELKGRISELFVIGDAREPRRIRNAIAEGLVIASEI